MGRSSGTIVAASLAQGPAIPKTLFCAVLGLIAEVSRVYHEAGAERMPGWGLLHLPESIVPFSIVLLGYPAEKKDTLDRYDETRVHWNRC